jgi:hypothetical protein
MTNQDSSTRINLLASEGMISVAFTPMLTSAYYNDLLTVVVSGNRSKDELRDLITQFALERQLQVVVEFC